MTRADQGRKKNELLLIVGCVPNAGMPAAHPVPSLRDKRSPGDEKRPRVSCLTWISWTSRASSQLVFSAGEIFHGDYLSLTWVERWMLMSCYTKGVCRQCFGCSTIYLNRIHDGPIPWSCDSTNALLTWSAEGLYIICFYIWDIHRK